MLNSERRTVEERVGVGLSQGTDFEVAGALGLVGITERLADAVFRLKYSLDAKSYDDALTGVYSLAGALNRRHHWRLRRGRLWWMSRRVLDYWLSDVCLACTGVRYETVLGSPHLSDRVCGACGGAGKRPMPWLRKLPRRPEGRRATKVRLEKHGAVCKRLMDMMYRYRQLLVELERIERVIGEKMIAKLAREMFPTAEASSGTPSNSLARCTPDALP